MGTISIEHGDKLFWLGRYTERVFSTLKAIKKVYDKMMDGNQEQYKDYLECFGIPDIYGDMYTFMKSFLFDINNSNSVAFSLERAYDNGIVLREEISTEALSFLQMAKDILVKAETSNRVLFDLLPLEDILFGFWGCIDDYIYDEEAKNIIMCGKYIERLDLYFRMNYPLYLINPEFDRLCECLRKVPKDTPYRYNTTQLSVLVEATGMGDEYAKHLDKILSCLSRLFEPAAS